MKNVTNQSQNTPHCVYVLGNRIDATSYELATRQVIEWAKAGESKMVCAANVHMIMETHDSSEFWQVIKKANLVTPDGMPLVWYMRLSGFQQQRVYGPDLMIHICAAAQESIPIGLLGSTSSVLDSLRIRLLQKFPGLSIPYLYAPPFGTLSEHQNESILQTFKNAGVRILFVGLGCPKQEYWMARYVRHSGMVMVGVGAAFEFHAGTKPQAPPWIQQFGLEWMFRWITEPRRLTHRYMKHNPRFLWLAGNEWISRSFNEK